MEVSSISTPPANEKPPEIDTVLSSKATLPDNEKTPEISATLVGKVNNTLINVRESFKSTLSANEKPPEFGATLVNMAPHKQVPFTEGNNRDQSLISIIPTTGTNSNLTFKSVLTSNPEKNRRRM